MNRVIVARAIVCSAMLLFFVQPPLVSVGPPFFVLCAITPLLQRWFSQTSVPAARDPYFICAASHSGSLVAVFTVPADAEVRDDDHANLLGSFNGW